MTFPDPDVPASHPARASAPPAGIGSLLLFAALSIGRLALRSRSRPAAPAVAALPGDAVPAVPARNTRRLPEATLPTVASLFGDALRVAIASAVLYFMGVLYYQTYADASGLPIDVYALPAQAVFAAPWETLMKGLFSGVYVGYGVLLVLYFITKLYRPGAVRVGHWWASKASRRRARKRERGRQPGGGPVPAHEDDRLDAIAGQLAQGLVLATGLLMIATVGVLHAGHTGKRDGERAIEQCETSVRIAPVKDASVAFEQDVKYCGKYGPDHLFVQRGTGEVVVLKESQVSSIKRPRRPRLVR